MHIGCGSPIERVYTATGCFIEILFIFIFFIFIFANAAHIMPCYGTDARCNVA